jgi:hypothetical protein
MLETIEKETTMINEAMFYDKNKINPFTEQVKDRAEVHGHALVKLRNQSYREIRYRPRDEEEDCDEMFVSGDWDFLWHMDGSSVTSSDFDMVKFDA